MCGKYPKSADHHERKIWNLGVDQDRKGTSSDRVVTADNLPELTLNDSLPRILIWNEYEKMVGNKINKFNLLKSHMIKGR